MIMRYSGFILFVWIAALIQSHSCIARNDAAANDSRSYVRRAASPENDKFDKNTNEQARIVGGYDATKGRNPYMVSLWSNNRHECGGIMIAPEIVLTAAHCINNGYIYPNLYIQRAILGRWDLKDPSEAGTTVISVVQQYMHDDYNVGTDQHDIGILLLESPKPDSIPIVRLNSDPNLVSPGDTLTSLGWGDLGDGTFPDVLQEVQVKALSNAACRNAPDPWNNGASYQEYIYEDMLCATDTNKDGCFGDSGGPLFVEGSSYNDDVVVGITSWGIGCARMPGVYARVSFSGHYEWIKEAVCNMSSNPPAYFGCVASPSGSMRDAPFPTVEPFTAEPSVAPSSSPSAGPPPIPSYTWSVTIPGCFTPAPTPTTRSSNGDAVPPTSESSNAEARASGTSSAMPSVGGSWLPICSSLLLLPTLLLLGGLL